MVEINFMGYANLSQVGSGLRQRLYSRAFIIASRSKPDERIAYLVLDTQSGDTAVRNGILEGVKALGPDYAHYGSSNIAVTGTHSHSGPGAWLNYLLPQVCFSNAPERALPNKRPPRSPAWASTNKATKPLCPGLSCRSSVHTSQSSQEP